MRSAQRLTRFGLTLLVCMLLLPVQLAAQGVAGTEDASRSYVLGAGDAIKINVFGEQDLSPEVLVDDRGRISYPFLGELAVAGLTLQELERAIVDGLRPDYLVDPRVSVSIREYRPFFVNGQVNTPGSYPFQPGLNVRKAVSLAGGFSERASQGKIFVIREGSTERVRLGLDDSVGPGDVLTVEESFF